MKDYIPIPVRYVGPVRISSKYVNSELKVPLATFESPMWPSTNRGASISCRIPGGIHCTLIDSRMTRSILLETASASLALAAVEWLETQVAAMAAVIHSTSQHARLKDWHYQIVGCLLYLRLEMTTDDAAGHNMVTKAADAVMCWLLAQRPELRHVSVSGNYCTDKKVSAVNGILGRGKYVIAEITIPRDVCIERLKTTPESIVNLHIKKNLMGSIIAGSLRTSNAHFANLLLALYLATGQDAANIVEGSQGFVHAELRENNAYLYFSVTVPHIIVGTVGNGKDSDCVRENLKLLGCDSELEDGFNAKRLAVIVAATVLCGELSLLAAQTNPGELIAAHMRFERGQERYRE